ncbi:radical SAM/SPASM domain-containing protein [Streptomyces sp. LaPpAH-108]|uniref:radical SAM/SPASM domain-containing protein n=1 Tax=Streptomyces sp. LaPpAH-108 TaxID=1155714 RepID=UPI0018F875D0|nr:radical SAM/SPASM domain-containing protein [Streptomyces sp. LaPpAH-108]
MSGERRVAHDPAERPFVVVWETDGSEGEPGERELDAAEARDLVRQVAAFGRPAPLFVVSGTDPFRRDDLPALIAYGTGLGVRTALSPTGAPALSGEQLRAVRDAGAVGLVLGLHGSTAELHDAVREMPGAHRRTLDTWDTARALGLKVRIDTAVSRRNLRGLPDIVRLVDRHGAALWSACFPVPAAPGPGGLRALTAREVEDVLNFVHDAGLALPVKTTGAHHFRRVVLQRRILAEHGDDPVAVLGLGPLYRELRDRTPGLGTRTRPPLDADTGRGFVHVSPTGTVHPGGCLPLSAGTVRRASLTSLYRTSPLFTGLRAAGMLRGRCGACEFRRVCGGSRSRAYGITGDPYAEEPWCAYQPGAFPYRHEVAQALATHYARPRPAKPPFAARRTEEEQPR